MGGNKKRRYTEGWIEFEDKNMAKFVAHTYNNQQVGMSQRVSMMN
jgi:ESF2/ABP1 family protein